MKKIHEYIHKRNRDKFYSKHIFDGSKIRLLCLHILNKNNLISPLARISKGIYLPHPLGIVIGKGVTIGKNCTIFQNVTIGQKIEEYENDDENKVDDYESDFISKDEDDLMDDLKLLMTDDKDDQIDENKPLIKQIDLKGIKTYNDILEEYESQDEESAVISRDELEQKAKEKFINQNSLP